MVLHGSPWFFRVLHGSSGFSMSEALVGAPVNRPLQGEGAWGCRGGLERGPGAVEGACGPGTRMGAGSPPLLAHLPPPGVSVVACCGGWTGRLDSPRG